MLSVYAPKNLQYFMDKFPEVKNLIASSDYISSCNFSMNFFPVVLNADHEVGMSMKVPISAYMCISQNTDLGVCFDQTISYDTYDDNIHLRSWSKFNSNMDQLSIYISDYLTSHHISPNRNFSIFMCRDRHTGFGYKLFRSIQLAYRLLSITWQIENPNQRNPSKHQEKIIKILKDIYSIVSHSWFKRWTFLGPLRYNNSHPVYFNQKEVVNLYQHKSDYIPVDIVLINFWAGYERNISLNSIDDRHDFMSEYITNINGNYQKDYLNNFAYCLKAEFINSYENLINNSNNDIYMQKLMQSIDHINNFANIVEWPNQIINQINEIIKNNKKFPNEYIWVLPMTSNQNSDNIMIISNKNKSRKTIDDILAKISQKHSFAIEYVSRIDEDYKNWIQINHNPSQGIYMPELSEYDCIIRFADGSYIYHKYSSAVQRSSDYSLYQDFIIIDSISNKIYRHWKALDSKDILSQTYTISVFAKLIKNLNHWISNKQLEASAYSKSMNQFSGKILWPIRKISEELLGSAIDIQITGSIYDYQIKLQKSNSKFIYIEKK